MGYSYNKQTREGKKAHLHIIKGSHNKYTACNKQKKTEEAKQQINFT